MHAVINTDGLPRAFIALYFSGQIVNSDFWPHFNRLEIPREIETSVQKFNLSSQKCKYESLILFLHTRNAIWLYILEFVSY